MIGAFIVSGKLKEDLVVSLTPPMPKLSQIAIKSITLTNSTLPTGVYGVSCNQITSLCASKKRVITNQETILTCFLATEKQNQFYPENFLVWFTLTTISDFLEVHIVDLKTRKTVSSGNTKVVVHCLYKFQ